MQPPQNYICPTICIGREILCLPHAGFLLPNLARWPCGARVHWCLIDLRWGRGTAQHGPDRARYQHSQSSFITSSTFPSTSSTFPSTSSTFFSSSSPLSSSGTSSSSYICIVLFLVFQTVPHYGPGLRCSGVYYITQLPAVLTGYDSTALPSHTRWPGRRVTLATFFIRGIIILDCFTIMLSFDDFF